MKKNLIIIASYVIFLVISVLWRGVGYSDWMFMTITFVVFSFAIFLAFIISNRRDRILSLRENLRKMDASLISLHTYSKTFNNEIHKKISQLIDDFLVSTVDYELTDFYKTGLQFMKLYEYVAELKTKNEEELNIKIAMMAQLEEMTRLRKVIEFNLSDKMQAYERGSIVLLSFATLFCLLYINDQSVASLILIPVLETVIIIILVTIIDLDSLRWQERGWIWKPVTNLFITLGLIPYFPQDVIKEKRVPKSLLSKLSEYRVATYKNPYPNISDKKIDVMRNNKA